MNTEIIPLRSGEMKITKMVVVVFCVFLFVLLSIGILPAQKEYRPIGVACLNPHYPCASLPQNFTGWPNLP